MPCLTSAIAARADRRTSAPGDGESGVRGRLASRNLGQVPRFRCDIVVAIRLNCHLTSDTRPRETSLAAAPPSRVAASDLKDSFTRRQNSFLSVDRIFLRANAPTGS